MRFSRRTEWDISEGELARAVREEEDSGKLLIDLTVSNPTRCGFAYDTEAIVGALARRESLNYEPDARGMRSAREAVAEYYAEHSAQVDCDALLLTTSTSEAYSFVFRLLCDAGDEVLVAQPSYPLFDFLAALDDVRLESYPTFYDYGWSIDFAELEQRIRPRTRALVLVHPNNPTGHATSAAELDELREMCARRGMALIVDEVFLDYGLEDTVDSVAAFAAPGLTFVISGLSKVAALPQMKVGWILCLGPERERREALARLEVVADTFLSMNAPAQHALPTWLATRQGIRMQIVARVRENVSVARLMGGFEALHVQAGWNVVLRLPQIGRGEGTAVRLVKEAGLLVHPGSFYGLPGNHFVVASTIGPAEKFKSGLARLRTWSESEG